ncbi:coiled-coil domain-containing protein, partial [Cellulomonas carbonis]
MPQHQPRRRLAAALLVALAVGAAPAVAAPGDDEVEAAHEAVASTAAQIARLESRLAEHSAVADTAWTAVEAAAERYTGALVAVEEAQQAARDAAEREEAARVELEAARAELGVIAMEAYRSGGSMDTVGAFLSADGFEDLVVRTEAVQRLGERAQGVVQRFQAAELVQATLAERTADALADAEAASAEADDALADAEAAQVAAQEQVDRATAERELLIVELAARRQTTVELERARQDAVD